jgi:diaminohydroxyphosphoribosylaminopyrimidine deaminase/5-amino-6-(5-phosphoribosylamino)uracil reductase
MSKKNLINHEIYMQRCFQLAKLGASFVAPNPMVGAVLVYNNTIIGEGYHQKFGAAHAEVNCINSVKEADKPLIPLSTLYVSLEPCAHFGKTPPCSDLIIQHKIPKVVISIQDNFAAVNGKGIERLKAHGIEVITGILEKEGKELLKHFLHFHQYHRPYITLKFAQTADGFLGIKNQEIAISNELSKRYVHHLRAIHQGILVGKNTILSDNPTLNVRYWNGKNPIKIVLGNPKNIPADYIIFNHPENTIFIYSTEKKLNINEILNQLYQQQIISVLVEGGENVLQQFIQQNAWDEAHIITNNKRMKQVFHAQHTDFITAPELSGKLVSTINLENDHIQIIKNIHAISHS